MQTFTRSHLQTSLNRLLQQDGRVGKGPDDGLIARDEGHADLLGEGDVLAVVRGVARSVHELKYRVCRNLVLGAFKVLLRPVGVLHGLVQRH